MRVQSGGDHQIKTLEAAKLKYAQKDILFIQNVDFFLMPLYIIFICDPLT